MYIVQTFVYMYMQVYTCFDSYKHVCWHTMMYRHLHIMYLHFMKCTDIVELCMYMDVSLWLQLFKFDFALLWPGGCCQMSRLFQQNSMESRAGLVEKVLRVEMVQVGEREIYVLLLPEMSRAEAAEQAGRAKTRNFSHCPALRQHRCGEAAPSGKAAQWLHWKVRF